jgi:hypothetical protein
MRPSAAAAARRALSSSSSASGMDLVLRWVRMVSMVEWIACDPSRGLHA